MRKLLLFLTALVISLAACEGNKKVNRYGYVFMESTGQNEYIMIDGQKNLIKFDVTSSQIALGSLHALKPSILYQNSEGDRIFVVGEYAKQSQTFRLSHWYLMVPFAELVVDNEAQVPHTVHKITRPALARTDFEPKNGFDPNDPAFDPKSFQSDAR